jgi:hypothetical protein
MKRVGRRSVLLVAMLTLAACGGSGGGGQSNSAANAITGVCATCQSDTDCEDGLQCQACTGGCTGTLHRCAGLDDSSTTVSCADGTYPAGCADIAGLWTLTETVDGQCTAAGETDPIDQSGTGTVTFEQNGCAVSYTVPETSIVRSGTIVGNRMRLTGPFLEAVAGSGASFSQNTVTIEGTVSGNQLSLSGDGVGGGTINGVPFSCTGSSTATGTQ